MLIITGDCFFFIDFNLLLLRNLFIIFKEILPFYSFFLSDSNLNSTINQKRLVVFITELVFFYYLFGPYDEKKYLHSMGQVGG